MAEAVDDAGQAPADAKGATGPARYSAVVYFHGMGSQRRYEEISRVIDRIDHHLVRQHRAGNSIGMLRNIRAHVEPLRPVAGSGEIVAHIRTAFVSGPKEQQQWRAVRFYEVYWAPVMAGNRSPWGVAKWLFKQPLRPWRTLRSPWRERQRLRRGVLMDLFERKGAQPPTIEERDYANLMILYDDFEGLDARRRFPAGTFDEFISYVSEQSSKTPDTAKRREALARAWLSAYRRQELYNASTLALMGLALVLLVGGVLFGILLALQFLLSMPQLGEALKKFDVEANWETVLASGMTLAGLVGLTRFLTNYLGDVEAWATYEETDIKHTARNKVLDEGLKTLAHVLSDPACERVTVVAHSLGTSVAHDALLAMTRRNRATNAKDPIAGPVPLHKIEHFVTMGSPIDKIEYFFESYSSQSHRYNRVIEALRGDIGFPPFTRNRHPHIHWINFWDQGDAISGPLHSPASARVFAQRVDNVHVANFRFPDTGASHTGYFDNRLVIDTLFRVIYLRERSFRTLPQVHGQPPDYKSVYLGRNDPLGTRAAHYLAAAAAPLFGLAGVVAWLFELRLFGYVSWALLIVVVVALFASYAYSRFKGQQNSI